jgi:hypothetical protein
MTRYPAIALFLILVACSPSPTPAPTEIAPAAPTDTTSPVATEAAEPTAGTVVTSLPLEAIWIALPGGGSQVTSPVTVQGQSRPTFEQALVVAVYGEDGSLLAMQPTTIASEAGSPGPYSATLNFSVDHEQPGRVAVYETSAMDGGIVHLSSTEVTLLPAGGTANIVSAPASVENMEILFPAANGQLSGGQLDISGFSEYYFESQLGLLLCGGGDGGGAADPLCGDAHNVLAFTVAMINSAEMGQPGPFNGTLTWSVSEETPARIIVYGDSPRDGGLVHVTSIPVLLLP